VTLVLNWLAYGVTASRKPARKTANRVNTDLALWERQVAAQWLAIDDAEEVSAADVASVFGDQVPEVPDEER
jgi:hypothetical protein